MVANTPHGPPSCCTKPIEVSGSGLNLQQDFNKSSSLLIKETTEYGMADKQHG